MCLWSLNADLLSFLSLYFFGVTYTLNLGFLLERYNVILHASAICIEFRENQSGYSKRVGSIRVGITYNQMHAPAVGCYSYKLVYSYHA